MSMSSSESLICRSGQIRVLHATGLDTLGQGGVFIPAMDKMTRAEIRDIRRDDPFVILCWILTKDYKKHAHHIKDLNLEKRKAVNAILEVASWAEEALIAKLTHTSRSFVKKVRREFFAAEDARKGRAA